MTHDQRKHRRKRRRAAVRHAIFTKTPKKLTGGRLGRVKPGKNFEVNEREILIPDLSDEFCGLKIVHFSDLHVGELITPAHLPHIVEAANAFEADLMAVTGDFVDYSNSYLPAVMEAMSDLRARYGVYFVLGNHDYLDDGQEVVEAFAASKLRLLLDEADVIQIGDNGCSMGVGGVRWSNLSNEMDMCVKKVNIAMKGCDLKILLAHHPHCFDAAHRHGIDLTLSGHTHGGQFLLSKKRGKKGSIGLANLGFRYTRGLYERGACRLFVSSGVGSWFPFRFRCPAEITRLTLQAVY